MEAARALMAGVRGARPLMAGVRGRARPLMAGVRGGVSGKIKQLVVVVVVVTVLPAQEPSGKNGINWFRGIRLCSSIISDSIYLIAEVTEVRVS